MPSLAHEALLLLFRNRPELAPDLLRDALGVAVPIYAEARIESAELTDIVPTEYRADLVVLLVDQKPVLGIVVEAQLELRRDDRKQYSWPVYVASLRARLGCPTCLLVVANDETTAERAREPIVLGPGTVMTPLVLGPASVPVVIDVEQAKRDPELAVLSAIAHGKDEPAVAIDLARVAFAACQLLDAERAMLYLDLVNASLGEIARIALEGLMDIKDYEFQGPYFRKKLADREAHVAAKALAEGTAKGLAEGTAKGTAQGVTRSILKLLAVRGVTLSADEEQRISSCTDVATLERWLEQAIHATTAAALFEE